MRASRQNVGAGMFLAIIITLAGSGCGQADSEPSTDKPVTPTAAKATAGPASAARPIDAAAIAALPPGTAPSASGSGPDGTSAGTPLVPFNFFAPPKIEVPIVKQNETREEKEAVRLIGFVDVERLKALLIFDGTIHALEVGDVYRDVEIVAIDPPRVTMQRDRQRWITELFDQPLVNEQANMAGAAGKLNGPQVTIGERSGERPGQLRGTPGAWLPGGLGQLFGGRRNDGRIDGPNAGGEFPPLPGFPNGDNGQLGPLPGLPPLPGNPAPPPQ